MLLQTCEFNQNAYLRPQTSNRICLMMTGDASLGNDVNSGALPRRSLVMRFIQHSLRLFLFLILTATALFVRGFAMFYQHVATIQPPVDPTADAIVVLTGGYQRIDHAVELLASGAGK